MAALGFKSRQSGSKIQINATQSSFVKFRGGRFQKQNLRLLNRKKMFDGKHDGIYVSSVRVSVVLPNQHLCLIWGVVSQVSLGDHPLPHCLQSPLTVNQDAPPLPWRLRYQPEQYNSLPLPVSGILIAERFSLIPLP